MPTRSFSEQALMVLILVLVAFLALAFSQSLFLVVFAPVVVYVLWGYSRRIKELENRVAELDGLSPKKSETREKPKETDEAKKGS
jgi:hypothetical protein